MRLFIVLMKLVAYEWSFVDLLNWDVIAVPQTFILNSIAVPKLIALRALDPISEHWRVQSPLNRAGTYKKPEFADAPK